MFVIIFKQHGWLNCEQEVYGPFDNFGDAEEALCNGAVPLLYGQGGREWEAGARQEPTGHRFIQELTWAEGCVL